jgi:8-oxo-dGTP pyrophosphatase MutT (NUDIX family)
MNTMIPNMRFEVALKVIMKNADGKILILRCSDASQMQGYYDFPGGRINEQEKTAPFQDIIAREMAEELGTDIRYTLRMVPVAVSRHAYTSDATHKETHIFWVFFEATYEEGEIYISSEHSGYRWVDLITDNIEHYFVKGPLEGVRHYFNQT